MSDTRDGTISHTRPLTILYRCTLIIQEIYNEIIRDLLNPSGGDLELLEDERGNIRVPGLSSVKAPNLTRVRGQFFRD